MKSNQTNQKKMFKYTLFDNKGTMLLTEQEEIDFRHITTFHKKVLFVYNHTK